jgi:hypothetical protein
MCFSEYIASNLSGANSPGEGEIKIIDWATSFVRGKSESIVICG